VKIRNESARYLAGLGVLLVLVGAGLGVLFAICYGIGYLTESLYAQFFPEFYSNGYSWIEQVSWGGWLLLSFLAFSYVAILIILGINRASKALGNHLFNRRT
jgi:ABC-type antimicrobial peptide transport system permease subunit